MWNNELDAKMKQIYNMITSLKEEKRYSIKYFNQSMLNLTDCGRN